jgi:hypothetical protein
MAKNGGYMNVGLVLKSTVVLAFLMSIANAQTAGNGVSEFNAQGKLVILRIVPGDKVAKLFVLGKKKAAFDFKKDAKILSVFLKNGASSEELKVNDRGDFYEVQGVPNRDKPYELSVQTDVKGEKDDVTIKINMLKP